MAITIRWKYAFDPLLEQTIPRRAFHPLNPSKVISFCPAEVKLCQPWTRRLFIPVIKYPPGLVKVCLAFIGLPLPCADDDVLAWFRR